MGSGWKIRVGKMIEIKDVIEGKKILYSCGICEVRYGLDVEIELNLFNGCLLYTSDAADDAPRV